jgi:hypothetical protein
VILLSAAQRRQCLLWKRYKEKPSCQEPKSIKGHIKWQHNMRKVTSAKRAQEKLWRGAAGSVIEEEGVECITVGEEYELWLPSEEENRMLACANS